MNVGIKVKTYILFAIISMFALTLDASAASNLTPSFDRLFLLVTILSAAVLILVISLWVYFIRKYRESEEVDRTPMSHETSRKFELGWTMVATFIVILLIIFSFPIIFNDTNIAEENGNGQRIIVEGTNSWQWYYWDPQDYQTLMQNASAAVTPLGAPKYDNNGIAYTNISLTVDTKYTFEFHNRGSWIHSYYVKDLNIKMDVIPGDVNYLTFTPTATGQYILQCTEFCGPGHSMMRGYVNVVEA